MQKFAREPVGGGPQEVHGGGRSRNRCCPVKQALEEFWELETTKKDTGSARRYLAQNLRA